MPHLVSETADKIIVFKILKINPSRKCHMRKFIKSTVFWTYRAIQWIRHNDSGTFQCLFHGFFSEHHRVLLSKQGITFF